MSIISTLPIKEKNRNEKMIIEYTRELDILPKGTIKEKKVKDKIYYYLLFREGDKVVTKYLGKNEESLILIKEQLARRKQLECMLQKLKAEKIQIKKLEAML
ncbi:MAG: hypothetical protein IJB97_10305 [Clostridia bacterium]|nr:hypothetical protein [Clostridia bacterium]